MIKFENIDFYKTDFEDYYISKCGKVLSTRVRHIKLRKICIDRYGYSFITIKEGNKTIMLRIHRLVAQHFIPNPKNKPQVNHINGIKNDNRVENLEWCTQSENQIHAYKIGLNPLSLKGKLGKLNKNSKSIKQLDLNGNLIKIWDSKADVQRELKIYNIHKCCKRRAHSAGGFKWEYV
jgi:hypothetical protein